MGGLTVDSGGATVTNGGASITQSDNSAALTVQSSHTSFTNDVMVLKTTATATGDFDYIQAQTTGGTVNFQVTGLGEVVSKSTTAADSSTAGSIRTEGGLGVKEKAHIGQGLTVDEGGATVTDGGAYIRNADNAVVLNVFARKNAQTNTVLQVVAKDTNGFNLIDAKTGAGDDGSGGNSKFTVDSAGAGVFSGTVTGSGTFQSSSDRRLKKRITQLYGAMEKINGLRGVNYYWRRGEGPHTHREFDDLKQVGFIAQEVEDVIPEVVRTDADGFKSMQYSGIIPYAVEALKLHDTTIAQLQGENKALRDTVARLQAEQAALQRQVALILSRMPAGFMGDESHPDQ